jgi:hypothetical protein
MICANFSSAIGSQRQNSDVHRLVWLVDRLVALNSHLRACSWNLRSILPPLKITDTSLDYVVRIIVIRARDEAQYGDSAFIGDGLALLTLKVHPAK